MPPSVRRRYQLCAAKSEEIASFANVSPRLVGFICSGLATSKRGEGHREPSPIGLCKFLSISDKALLDYRQGVFCRQDVFDNYVFVSTPY
jgi:hypothetical protein